MFRSLILAGASALILIAPAVAQDMMASTGSLTPTEVGVSPLSATSATDYVKLAADSDNYEIQSSRLALTKSKRDDIKSFAKQMITDHTGTTKALMAALKNDDRTIARPSTKLSAANAAKIALLKKAPKATFDDLYLQQQAQAHQAAWALHKGYATDGPCALLGHRFTVAAWEPILSRERPNNRQSSARCTCLKTNGLV
jgi:putative membrane protein